MVSSKIVDSLSAEKGSAGRAAGRLEGARRDYIALVGME